MTNLRDIERAARAAYEKFNENLIPALEPRWEDLAPDFKERMMDAQEAAIRSSPPVPTREQIKKAIFPLCFSAKNSDAIADAVLALTGEIRNTEMTELKFCKFCGVKTDKPCVDETDLHIYSQTIDRCADANFARIAELHYECAEKSAQQP